MASTCGFPIRSAADHHLKKLLEAVQTKRKVNLSCEVTTADLADLRRTAELFREVVPLLRGEIGKLRTKLLGGAQTNPFLETVTDAPKRKKKVVTFAADQQTNPFLAESRLEVETNSFIRPAVLPIGAGATLPQRNLPAACAPLPDRRTSELKTVPAAANIAPNANPKHSGASVEAVSEQAEAPERKKKVITFPVNQQRSMVVQYASESTAHQARASVKVDQHVVVSSLTTGKTNPDITFQCPANQPQKSRRRSRSRRPSAFRPPVSQSKLDTATANQFIENKDAVALPPCYFCGGKHALCRCSEFFFLRLAERLAFVQQMKLCINCFSQRHDASICRDKPRCLRCPDWHHTLLHRNVRNSEPAATGWA